jgi:hypothetical protein
MKRTDTIFKTITVTAVAMAITAGPALGSIGYPSPSPNSWGSSASAAGDYTSVNASLNEPTPAVTSPVHSSVLASVNEPTQSVAGVVHTSVNASLNEPSQSVKSLTTGVGHSSVLASVNEPTSVASTPVGSSVASIVGSPQTAPVETAAVVHDQSGFDWTDAFLGAAGALTLALLSAAAVHTLRRRERMSLGSQV